MIFILKKIAKLLLIFLPESLNEKIKNDYHQSIRDKSSPNWERDTNFNPRKKLKIGLAWSGSPKHLRDFCRSINLIFLENIFETSNVEFFAIQKVFKENDKKFLKKFKNVHDCTDHLKDFMPI